MHGADGVAGVDPLGRCGDRLHAHALAAEQPGHRPGQRDPADGDHPLGQVALQPRLDAEQQRPVRDRAVGARRRTARRPRASRSRGPRRGRRRRSRARAGRRRPRGSAASARPARAGPGVPRPTDTHGRAMGSTLERLGPGPGLGRHQRLAQGHVEVDRTRHAARVVRGWQRPRDRLTTARRRPDRDGARGRRAGMRPPQPAAEHAGLGRGLVGPGAPQLGRPVGAQHDQGNLPVVRLEDRRVEVGDRRAGRGHDHRGNPGDLGQAQGQEARRALVDPHVQAQPPARSASCRA